MKPSLKATCIVSEAFEELYEENVLRNEIVLDEGIFGTIGKMWNFGKKAFQVGKKAWDVGSKIYRVGKSLKDGDVFNVLKREIFADSDFDNETLKSLSQAVTGREAEKYRGQKLDMNDIVGLMSRRDQAQVKSRRIDQEDMAKLMMFLQSATGSRTPS